MEIPKIIHQSWKSGAQDLIEPEASIRKRLINMHPDWDFKFWTDEDNEKLIKDHYPWFLPYWNQYLWPIQKADAARYFYMHRYGGVYLDLDMLCLRSLDDLFEKIMKNQTQNIYSSTMKNAILFEEYPNSYSMQSSIYNAIMASLPFAPIWTMCFYVLQKNLLIQKQMKPNQDLEKIVFQTTGPKMLCEAFNKTLEGQRAKDTDLLPYFYTNPVALPTKYNSNELVIFNRMHTDPLFEAADIHSSEAWRIIPREFLTPENLPNSYFSHRSNRTWNKDLS